MIVGVVVGFEVLCRLSVKGRFGYFVLVYYVVLEGLVSVVVHKLLLRNSKVFLCIWCRGLAFD